MLAFYFLIKLNCLNVGTLITDTLDAKLTCFLVLFFFKEEDEHIVFEESFDSTEGIDNLLCHDFDWVLKTRLIEVFFSIYNIIKMK